MNKKHMPARQETKVTSQQQFTEQAQKEKQKVHFVTYVTFVDM